MPVGDTNLQLATPQTVTATSYDVVVIGSGVAGAIVAKQMADRGKSVLIIEAGTSEGLTTDGFAGYVQAFHVAINKSGNSPYPFNPNALSPTDDSNGYFQEAGPLPISGSYTRVTGGTTMHWEGKALRMLPEDFQLKTNYGVGLDWPIGYDLLEPYYRRAEYELGVSGDADEQRSLGVPMAAGYVLPHQKIPPSFLDEQVDKKIGAATVEFAGQHYPLRLTTFPQARNGEPNPAYRRPADAPAYDEGTECGGNASCVPICPFQAKYDARRTLGRISGNHVSFMPQAVASKIEIDSATGRVTGIRFKHYQDRTSPAHTEGVAKGRLYVLACNAIENARLLLASDLQSSSGLVGRNLMDHPFLLAWALLPEPAGTMRGPLVTSGIGAFRKGPFRRQQAAFAVDIHNDGWGWAGISATDVLRDAVDSGGKYGPALRRALIDGVSRQLLLAFMCELPADPDNRVTVDPRYVDQLGNLRPVMHFGIPDYSKEGIAYARSLSRQIFSMLGAQDHTQYAKSDPAYFEYRGEGYWFRGGNHFSGTHIMGTSKTNSVVSDHLRSWDHDNLYVVGGGAMPSIGSANITLTIAATVYRASEQMLKDLG